MRVHLIDGTYELFRAYYGAPPAQAADRHEVGATRSFGRQLLRIAREEAATHVAVAFDHVIESFRNELFAGYKTGEGLDPLLLGQFDLVEEMAAALGFVVWSMVEFEADDALATGAALAARDPRVTQVRIVSPDKDLAQCVSGERVVELHKGQVLDETGVRARFGIAPASIPDFLALVGDDADGIPGLPGFGERSAATLLAEHGHLEHIPADPREWRARPRGAERLAAVLSERREDALLYRTLATLRTDVPLTESVDDLEWRGPRLSRLAQLCARIDDQELAQRFSASKS